MPDWRPILPGAGPPTAYIFSWPCWPTTSCWLLLFQREETAKVAELKHTTLAIARLRFLFLTAKIWRHAGRVGISYSDQYAERGLFQRLMDRLRKIVGSSEKFQPVLATALQL